MTKALIDYGTRYGATASTSEEIAEVFRQEGMDVRVFNAKKDKVKDITEYELVIVGSGIQINRWTKEPEKFPKKFQKDLVKKKVALFVCCGSTQPLEGDEDKDTSISRAKTKYLEEKATKYNIQPVALGLFGGVYDFNKMSWMTRKIIGSVKPKLEEAGYKETKPGLYDTRDLNAIRSGQRKSPKKQTPKPVQTFKIDYGLKKLGAGGGSRARDFWAPNFLGDCSPDHESGAITRLGYPGLCFSLLF